MSDGSRPTGGRAEVAVRGCAVAGCAALVALAVLGALHEAGGLRLVAVALAASGAAVLGVLAGTMNRATRPRDRALGEDRFRLLFEASPVGIGLADERGLFVAVNPALCTLFGRPAGELLGRSSVPFTHPDDLGAHAAATSLVATAADGVARVQKRYVRPDGEVRWAWLTFTHVPGDGPRPWTLAHIQDVTERVTAEAELQSAQESLAAVAGAVRDLRLGTDVRGTVLEAARTVAAASAAYLVELETRPDGEPVEDPALVVTAARGAPDGVVGQRIGLDSTAACVHVFRTGEPLFLADPADQPIASPALLALSGARSLLFQPVTLGGAVVAVLAVAWDDRLDSVSDQRAATVALLADEAAVALDTESMLQRLEHRATTDALTGLPNRRAWDQALPVLIDAAGRTGTPLTVAIADLDHFKRYNDALGHQAGDDLLQRFADHCAAALREFDLVARWGGEEFAVALPECAADSAVRVLERLRADLPDGQTCSVGFAVWDGVESPEELLARADAALYTAKSLGRDTLCGAGSPPPRLS